MMEEKIYEIDNKIYKVISKCVDNPSNIEKLYDVICEFVLTKLNGSVKDE